MLMILSPAKTLKWDKPQRKALSATNPMFLKNSDIVANVLKSKSKQDLKKLMGLSDNLATLNFNRNSFFLLSDQAKEEGISHASFNPAIFSFDGPAYKGIDAWTLDESDLEYLQENLWILCGLYGALRPMDLIQQYRLEMGTKLQCGSASDLYGYWRRPVTSAISKQLAPRLSKVLINLASQEYSKTVDFENLDEGTKVITCVFKDDGRVLSVFAKKARGLMVRYLAQNKCHTPEQIKGFDLEGYKFSSAQSSDTEYVFARDKKAFDLKLPLALWNLGLSVFSTIGMVRTVPHLFWFLYSNGFNTLICTVPSIAYGSGAAGMWTKWFILSKIPELGDTVFIVLRKKPLIFLHWYHHVTVLLYCWHSYVTESSMGIFFISMNYSVHAIMYFYYFLAAIRYRISWLKPVYITIAQISQMFVGVAVCIGSVLMHMKNDNACAVKYDNLVAATVMYASYFGLFFKLAYDRYMKKPTQPIEFRKKKD